MKISYKSLVAAVALAMGGTANAAILDSGTNFGGQDSNLIVSVYNLTSGSSTVLNTGLTLADFRTMNVGSAATPTTTANQSWNMNLSGLSINPGDHVDWMIGAGRLQMSYDFGVVSSLNNSLPKSTIAINDGIWQAGLQKFDGYVNSIDVNPGYTVVNGSNGAAGEQSRIFTAADGQPFAGLGWKTNWGNGYNWDSTNALDQSSGVYFATIINDVTGGFQTYDPLLSANLTSSGTFTISAISAVPVPAAAWLFGSGLVGLVGVARRRKQ